MKYVVSVVDTKDRKLWLTRHVYGTYAEALIAIREIKEGALARYYKSYSVIQTDHVEKTWKESRTLPPS